MADVFESTEFAVAAVKGENTSPERNIDAEGGGVFGICHAGVGVRGISTSGRGMVAKSDTDYGLRASSRTSAGIRSSSVEGNGVEGWAIKSEGVVGHSETGSGVIGTTLAGSGVKGISNSGRGVEGWSTSNYGVSGDSQGFVGVRGTSVEGRGTEGWSTNGEGVFGISTTNTGVLGVSDTAIGVYGKGGRLAGFFEGDVEVTGDLRLTNADCAEDFDVAGADTVEPGTVMVLGNEGSLAQSHQAYDKRVAGVISGAGDYKPGIVLDRQPARGNRQPIALLGKVFCKVDAQFGAIEVGDLLTTSPTPGHAMKTSDPLKAFGAVIGKALRPLIEGQGLIPILIALQ